MVFLSGALVAGVAVNAAPDPCKDMNDCVKFQLACVRKKLMNSFAMSALPILGPQCGPMIPKNKYFDEQIPQGPKEELKETQDQLSELNQKIATHLREDEEKLEKDTLAVTTGLSTYAQCLEEQEKEENNSLYNLLILLAIFTVISVTILTFVKS